mgnify:CR=1 FL=1
MDWLRHTLSVGRSLGFNIEMVCPGRVTELHPFYNLDGVLGALHTPDDGHVDPTNVTMAMAAGARAKGARIIRRCRATNITQAASGGWVVETEKGTITCEHVVNAGGTYARQMGEWSGLQLPMTSMTHHYQKWMRGSGFAYLSAIQDPASPPKSFPTFSIHFSQRRPLEKGQAWGFRWCMESSKP